MVFRTSHTSRAIVRSSVATISAAALTLGLLAPASAAPSFGSLSTQTANNPGGFSPHGSVGGSLDAPVVPLDRSIGAIVAVSDSAAESVRTLRVVLDLPSGASADTSSEVVVSTKFSTQRSKAEVVLAKVRSGQTATITVPGPLPIGAVVAVNLKVAGVAEGAPISGFVSAELGGTDGTGTEIGAKLEADGTAKLG